MNDRKRVEYKGTIWNPIVELPDVNTWLQNEVANALVDYLGDAEMVATMSGDRLYLCLPGLAERLDESDGYQPPTFDLRDTVRDFLESISSDGRPQNDPSIPAFRAQFVDALRILDEAIASIA